MDTEKDTSISMPGLARPHTPRKPRPSEIAAKKARAAKKKGRKKKKKKAVKRPKVVKTKREPGKPKVRSAPVVYSERLDMRMTKAAKAKIVAKAKKMRRTITSMVIEAIEKFK